MLPIRRVSVRSFPDLRKAARARSKIIDEQGLLIMRVMRFVGDYCMAMLPALLLVSLLLCNAFYEWLI